MHDTSESFLLSYNTSEINGRIIDGAYSSNGELFACSVDNGDLLFHDAIRNKAFAPVKTSNTGPFLVEFIDAELLVHTKGKELEVLNLHKQQYICEFSAHTSEICSVSTSSMFRNTISVGNCEAYMWDIREKNPHARLPVQGTPFIKYSPDGRIFMVLFEERKEMSLFDVRSYMAGPYMTKKVDVEGYSAMHFSPDSFGIVLFQNDGFSIADGFSGDVTMQLTSEVPTSGCFTQDSASFIFTTSPYEISMATLPDPKAEAIFSVNEEFPITGLRYNSCFEQVAIIHKHLTFLQKAE